MTMKTLLLGAVMTGALMVPAIAMAADAAAPVAETKTEAVKTEAPKTEAAKTEAAKEAPKDAAAAPAGDDRQAKAFSSFDTDKNGSISEDEFLNHKKDAKSEGKYTPEQIAEKKKERFKEIDTSGDGKIDQAEFSAYGDKLKARRLAPKVETKADAPKADAAKEAPKEAPAH
jgi:hypothetical protein